jgi:cleavage and polyadenylation specificity factor subunit 2
MATLPSLDAGFSQDLFLEWCTDPSKVIVLASKGPAGSLARRLYDEWNSKVDSAEDVSANGLLQMDFKLPLRIKKRIPLEGEELLAHLRDIQLQREREAAEVAAARLRDEALDVGDGDESDEDYAVDTEEAQNPLLYKFDAYVGGTGRSGGFFKGQGAFRMFPAFEPKRRFDEYGEIVNPDDYIDKENIAANAQQADLAAAPEDLMDIDQREGPQEPEVPGKFVADEAEIHVRCKVQFVDFEGLTDGRSIKNILPQVQPKKLVGLIATFYLSDAV